ncbi:MAG: hypothetical protein MZV70_01040 [Desulfobacterales bacterium]|nr:hypothetical protein [Desulfobacterales bacterium]
MRYHVVIGWDQNPYRSLRGDAGFSRQHVCRRISHRRQGEYDNDNHSRFARPVDGRTGCCGELHGRVRLRHPDRKRYGNGRH